MGNKRIEAKLSINCVTNCYQLVIGYIEKQIEIVNSGEASFTSVSAWASEIAHNHFGVFSIHLTHLHKCLNVDGGVFLWRRQGFSLLAFVGDKCGGKCLCENEGRAFEQRSAGHLSVIKHLNCLFILNCAFEIEKSR